MTGPVLINTGENSSGVATIFPAIQMVWQDVNNEATDPTNVQGVQLSTYNGPNITIGTVEIPK